MGVQVIRRADGARGFVRRLRAARRRLPGLDARRYCGRIQLQEAPLDYQRRIRGEWSERTR